MTTLLTVGAAVVRMPPPWATALLPPAPPLPPAAALPPAPPMPPAPPLAMFSESVRSLRPLYVAGAVFVAAVMTVDGQSGGGVMASPCGTTAVAAGPAVAGPAHAAGATTTAGSGTVAGEGKAAGCRA